MDGSIFGNSEFVDTSDQPVTTEALSQRYQKSWRQLERIVFAAKQFLHCLGGSDLLPESPQQGASYIFFKKMTRHAASILKICPEPVGSVGDFDRDSAAAIARVVYENYTVLFYSCLEKVGEDEWSARNNLLGLRSLVANMEVWEKAIDKPPSDELRERIEETRKELRQNTYFQSLQKNRQDYLLLGHKAMFLSIDEIDSRLGNEKQRRTALYKIFSNSVHTTPSAFRIYNANEQDDKAQQFDLELSSLALTVAAYYLNRATIEVKELIPRWSEYKLQGFNMYMRLRQRDDLNEKLSKERRARRRSQGEWL